MSGVLMCHVTVSVHLCGVYVSPDRLEYFCRVYVPQVFRCNTDVLMLPRVGWCISDLLVVGRCMH